MHRFGLLRQSVSLRRDPAALGAVLVLTVTVAGAQPPAQPGGAAETPAPLSVGRLADPEASAGQVAPVRVPGQQPVPSQAPLEPLPVTRLEEEPREAFLDAGRTFSLRIGEPQPVHDLLLLLVRDTRFSIVAAPGVTGTFVGELRNVTLEQALDLVLHPLELDYAVDRSAIRVFPRRTETRWFDVDYVQTARTTRRTLGTVSSNGQGDVWSVESSERSDFFVELTAGVQALLSADGRATLDRKAALLQVTDYPDRLDRIGLYVEAVVYRATRQVEIEAMIIEIALDDAHAAGLNWGAVLATLGGQTRTSAGRGLGIDLADPSPLVDALAAQGGVNVLARPRVVATNNEPAYMRVSRHDVYFVTTTSTDPATGVLLTTTEPQGVTEGFVLTVTPQIAADGIIQMSVSPRVTERTGETTSPQGDTVPVLSVREVDTLVRVHSGETAVVSGMLQGARGRKTDLVVLLTPTLVVPTPTAAGRR